MESQIRAAAPPSELTLNDLFVPERHAELKVWQQTLLQFGEFVWSWELFSDRVEFGDGWLEDMGHRAQDYATGEQWFTLVHPDDVAGFGKAIGDCVTGETPAFDYHCRIRRADGSYRWVRSRAIAAARDERGQAIRLLGINSDAHEERSAQEALAAAEHRWKFALEGSGSGVWDWNLVTNEVFFSRRWKEMLGFGPDDLDPTIETWRELALPEDLAASDAAIAAYVAGETDEYRCECRVRTRDGSLKWILDRGAIVERRPDGTPLRMIGTHDDITHAKRREDELRESRQRLERIAALIPGMVYQYRLQPDGLISMPFTSEGIRRIYDVAPEHVRDDATPVFRRVHPDDKARVVASIESSAANMTQWDEQYRVVVGGETRWVHGIANPMADPQVAGAVLWHGYISDITERKHDALELARRARALELANEDLEQFNYVASHDLKEPLRGIRHLSEWIAEDLGDDIPAPVRNNLERMTTRVERLRRLVDDLAAYSRAGRGDAELTPVAPAELVEEICTEVDLRGCRVDNELADLPPFVTARIALKTVLRNLVVNAAVHHDRPQTGSVRVSAERAAGAVHFLVEDDGPGIAPEHHDRVFRMSQRLDPEHYAEGSGSGLAIVRRILTQIDSRIELESPLNGRGSRFRFAWPLAWPCANGTEPS
ncbi:MAG: PAS domain-containing sensor histidine kinase [Gammaproteobacteria bacterium]